MANQMHELNQLKEKVYKDGYITQEDLEKAKQISKATSNQEARKIYAIIKKKLEGDDQ